MFVAKMRVEPLKLQRKTQAVGKNTIANGNQYRVGSGHSHRFQNMLALVSAVRVRPICCEAIAVVARGIEPCQTAPMFLAISTV